MAKRPEYHNGGIYHVYNRGVEKRKVFLDSGDHVRFVHDLYVLNDEHAHLHGDRVFAHHADGRDPISTMVESRETLVDIIAWVLMPNHYHLVLQQRVDSGVSRFMQKLGIGYTMYFNERYERSGVLFQGKYKVKEVATDEYLRHLVHYVHGNPTALWREGRVERGVVARAEAAVERLRGYRWSSYPDYVGEKNFPSVRSEYIADQLGLLKGKQCERDLRDWLQHYGKNVFALGPIAIDAE